jgi:acyl-CoA reductase-like NAD-dependent aldehyde dehydrogenase
MIESSLSTLCSADWGAVQRLGDARGFAYAPTLLTGVDESFGIVSSEQFGPALPIVRCVTHRAPYERASKPSVFHRAWCGSGGLAP